MDFKKYLLIDLNAFIFPFDVYFFLNRRFEVTIVFAAPKSFGFRPVTLLTFFSATTAIF